MIRLVWYGRYCPAIASTIARKNAATNKAMITGTFHRRSLVKAAPHLPQPLSTAGAIAPQRAQTRRDAVTSRPHIAHVCPLASA